MLTIETTTKFDPLSEIGKYLRAPRVSMKMSGNSLQIHGKLEESLYGHISSLDIARVRNNKSEKEEASRGLIKEKGGSTFLASNYKLEENETEMSIFKGGLYEVDFGQPFGSEFGYKHPALVIGKSSTNNCFIVIPFTSKTKFGKVYQIKFSEDNLHDADEAFLQNARDKVSHALFDNQCAVDAGRFIKYCGTLDEKVVLEILKEGGKTTKEIKRNITMESLQLTEKQTQMLNTLNRTSDLFGVANNSKFTYEQRVRGILNIFGFKVDMGGEVDYLLELIKNTKCKIPHIDFKYECEQIAKYRPINAQFVNTKLVEMTKKKFHDLHPCLLEFVCLVNKFAA